MIIQFSTIKNNELSWASAIEFCNTGHTSIICPKCHSKPVFSASYSPLTRRLERLVGSCKCGYIRHCALSINFEPLPDDEKGFAMGYRKISTEPLTEEQINLVKEAAKRIKIPEAMLVFNDPDALISPSGTSYHFDDDKIYITQNVFPDDRYASTHPRDLLSVAAVLAHEYYGHRPNRDEYLTDAKNGTETTPYWKDEVRASINAAKYAPGLTQMEKVMLIQDAEYRARENFQTLEMDDYMKNILWGDGTAKPIAGPLVFRPSIDVDTEVEAQYAETFDLEEPDR